jgi:hypothetical protein
MALFSVTLICEPRMDKMEEIRDEVNQERGS